MQTSDPGKKVITLVPEPNPQSYCLPGGDLIRRIKIFSPVSPGSITASEYTHAYYSVLYMLVTQSQRSLRERFRC